MKKKLNLILLIDDDETTNFLNKRTVEKGEYTEKVISVDNGKDALTFLTSKREGTYPNPDLIFLDINMPGMNGWEFMEQYKNLAENQQSDVVIVMLTTSANPEDAERALAIPEIDDFKHKPLNKTTLDNIMENYFSDDI